ncbi:MAG: ABC transporter ATP-binding protein [Cyclobacteriaceae bacterium]
MSLLSCHQLDVGYRHSRTEKRLFNALSLQLRPAALTCFMGPNGAGKSTLMRTLAGLHPPLAGHVQYQGRQLEGSTAPEAIALVLTERVTTTHMTAREFVGFGRYPYLKWHLRLSTEDHELIEQSLARVQVQDLANRSIAELSDGQMQMVMIARALAQHTPILLLDEPTAHLDLNNRVEIMNLLRRLAHEENKSILVATHELDLALQTADEIWLASDQHMLVGIPEDLVLDGAFDRVFQLKGFDLRTGKIMHHDWRAKPVHVQGEGFALLWTRNALEREGFTLSAEAPTAVRVAQQGASLQWHCGGHQFPTIRELVIHLTQSK